MHGYADDFRIAKEFPGQRKWHVILPYMDAIGIGRQRHIDPVVHQKKSFAACECFYFLRLPDYFTGAFLLFTVLDDGAACIERLLYIVNYSFSRESRIGDL